MLSPMLRHLPYRTFLWAASVLLGGGVVGCTGAAKVPDMPALDELETEYDEPTAELEQGSVREALGSTSDLDGLAAGFRATGGVVDNVADVKEPVEQVSGDGVQLQGSVRATLRCPGNLAVPDYDEAVNGSVSLTLAIEANRIHRTMIGQANDCVLGGELRGVAVAVRLAGVIALDVGEDIGFGVPWTRKRLLVSLQGNLQVGDYSVDGITARIAADRVEHLLRLPDGGTVVVSIEDSGFTVRDRDVTWSCSRDSGPCSLQ